MATLSEAFKSIPLADFGCAIRNFQVQGLFNLGFLVFDADLKDKMNRGFKHLCNELSLRALLELFKVDSAGAHIDRFKISRVILALLEAYYTNLSAKPCEIMLENYRTIRVEFHPQLSTTIFHPGTGSLPARLHAPATVLFHDGAIGKPRLCSFGSRHSTSSLASTSFTLIHDTETSLVCPERFNLKLVWALHTQHRLGPEGPKLWSLDLSSNSYQRLLRVHQAHVQHYIGLDVLDLYPVITTIPWLKTEDIAGSLEGFEDGHLGHPFNPDIHVVPRLQLYPCVLKFSEAIHSMLNLTCIQPRSPTLVDASDSFDDVVLRRIIPCPGAPRLRSFDPSPLTFNCRSERAVVEIRPRLGSSSCSFLDLPTILHVYTYLDRPRMQSV
ncbi:hypothetical protein C8R46DRAFT_1229811 [Mycena filopes]|nr:hypothetical protein C8R46DRAFT_1229811 [Mycena filopes]